MVIPGNTDNCLHKLTNKRFQSFHVALLVASLTRCAHLYWGTEGPLSQELGPDTGLPNGLEADAWQKWEEAMGDLFLLWVLRRAKP